MKVQCLSCGVEKDTEVKEVYPYPEDGLVDDPLRPVWRLDCQDGRDWREVVVCHECLHRLDPDLWINRGYWEALDPVTPFEELPRHRLHRQFAPKEGWDTFTQIDALVTAIWMELRRKDWGYCNGVDPVTHQPACRWSSRHDDSVISVKYEGERVLEFTVQDGLASEAMKPLISQSELIPVVPPSSKAPEINSMPSSDQQSEYDGQLFCTVPVQIVRYVDDHFPGWVEAVLIDASGRTWSFVEKVAIFTESNLGTQSVYPHPGVLPCMLVDEGDYGICTIDTQKPCGVVASGGESRFEVPRQQVTKIQ